jgi:2-(1,2-epoxy-1,2-dihydrophenyl)acetyl-CoA isomerase
VSVEPPGEFIPELSTSKLRVSCGVAVGTVELCQPPNNHMSAEVVRQIANAVEALDADRNCRVIVLCSEGKHFCAGAAHDDLDHRDGADHDAGAGNEAYGHVSRLARTSIPMVAAVQGAAIGAGLGLSLMADFRVASSEARFSANFARLGFHHGFALTATLEPVVGFQRAAELLMTGKRINGDEAFAMGLCDRLVSAVQVRAEAYALAQEIAASAPLAVRSIRATLRDGYADRVDGALAREWEEQCRLRETSDFAEGVNAMLERRPPVFLGE